MVEKKCGQLLVNRKFSSRDEINHEKDGFLFRGRFGTVDGVLFRYQGGKVCRPLVLSTPATCKAAMWFQLERSGVGHWSFSVWAMLDEEGCEGVKVEISIAAPTQRAFSGSIKLLPALSKTKKEAYDEGECLIVFDQHIKANERQDIAFDFAIKVVTNIEWRRQLNTQSSMADHLRLEEALIGRIVPHKFPNPHNPPNASDVKSDPANLTDDTPTDQPQQQPPTQSEPSFNLRIAPAPLVGEGTPFDMPGLLGPPPPLTTDGGHPHLIIYPPAELGPSTSSGEVTERPPSVETRPPSSIPSFDGSDDDDEEMTDAEILRFIQEHQ